MEEFKVGDWVKVKDTGCHNSKWKNYNYSIAFTKEEISDIVQILEIDKPDSDLALIVNCKKGLTALRPSGVTKVLSHEIPNFEIQYEIC